jgi:uncharacterized integral membrane protein
MVKDKILDIKRDKGKLLLWVFQVLIATSIPAYKFSYATADQSWRLLVLTGLGSIVIGIMVSCVVFGGQLSNKYCSRKTLDSICKWGIVVLSVFLAFFMILYYFPLLIGIDTSVNLGALIFLCIFDGMLIGIHGVRRVNSRAASGT